MDPLSALALIKGGITAGKQIASMSKEIGAFFDSIDSAKKAHEKKKKSLFASSNEEAMDTWLKRQQAADAENQLREVIVNTRGLSAWQELLKLRRDIAQERREMERRERLEAQERREAVELAVVSVALFVLIIGGFAMYLDYVGVLDLKRIRFF